MRQQILHQFCIALAAGIIFFANLGLAGLWDEDEPIYASCAREMIQRNDWVVPMFNGQMFPDKPPLMFWTMIAGFKMFGINEFGARFWSAVVGIGVAIATYHLGRRLFTPEVGFWAGLVTASSIIFTVSARAATVDASLTLVTTLAMLCFVIGGIGKRRGAGDSTTGPSAGGDRPDFLPQSWFSFVGMWAALAVAVLAKGPIGLLLPAAAIGLFLMIMNNQAKRAAAGSPPSAGWKARLVGIARCLNPLNFLRSLWQMRPFTGVAMVLAMAVPWYAWVGIRTDGAWLEGFFAQYNLRPFTQPIQGHHGPFWYYVPALLIGFFPWSVFLGPTLFSMARRVREGHPWRPGYILLACWIGLWFVFWSICRTKLPHYLLPAYPALALLTGCFLHGWITDPSFAKRWRLRVALGIVMLAGVAIAVALPFVARIYVPGEELLGDIGLILVLGGAAALYFAEQGRRQAMVAAFAVTSCVFLTAIFGIGTVLVDRHQNAKPLMAEVRQGCPEKPQMAAFRFLQKSLVYYAGDPVTYCTDAGQLRRFLACSRHPRVITHDSHLGEIERQFPGEFRVVARRPRFLHSGDVVVLAPRTDSPIPLTAGKMGSGQR